jgi:hypothetical protein
MPQKSNIPEEHLLLATFGGIRDIQNLIENIERQAPYSTVREIRLLDVSGTPGAIQYLENNLVERQKFLPDFILQVLGEIGSALGYRSQRLKGTPQSCLNKTTHILCIGKKRGGKI